MTGIRPLLPEDAHRCAQVLARAFFTDPPMEWVFRDPSTRLDRLRAVMQGALDAVFVPLGHSFTTTTGDGMALWAPPDRWRASPEATARLAASVRGRLSGAELDRMRTFSELMDADHPKEPHWYLAVLGVEPSRQGRGVGATLLAHCLALVDERGGAAYLESSNERNLPLYQRLGFEVTGIFDLPDGGPSLWRMWRSARTSNARGPTGPAHGSN